MQGEEIFQTIPQCAWFSQGGRRKRQKPCNLSTRKFSWKSSSTTHQPFLLSNPKILKALPKTFPYKMKPTKCSATEKNWGEKSKRKGEEGEQKEKVKSAVSLLIPKTILKFCFLSLPKLHKWIFCIWIRKLQSVRPVNGFVVCIIYLLKAMQTVTRTQLSYLQNTLSGKISRSKWVNEG